MQYIIYKIGIVDYYSEITEIVGLVKSFDEFKQYCQSIDVNIGDDETLDKNNSYNVIGGAMRSVLLVEIINLFADNGFKYGHGWLGKPIPETVVSRIKEIIENHK